MKEVIFLIPYVLSELFFRVFASIHGEEKQKSLLKCTNINKLESTLNNYLIKTMAYKNSYINNMKEVELSFENIINNSFRYNTDVCSTIEAYGDDYIALLDKNHYTKLFFIACNEVYSENFDIKRDTMERHALEVNAAIKNIKKHFEIVRVTRLDEESFPSLVINNIETFEEILKNYVEAIKESDSFYNIFDREGFSERSNEENIKMIFEGALLNVTNIDASNMEQFFRNYTSYIKDDTFQSIRYPSKVGELFNDELYIMAKRSELWYETPYYLSFMLKNKRIELPNIRMGISISDNKRKANIIATQTSQMMKDNLNFLELQEEIKRLLPRDSYYRFINPTHLVSLVLTLGYLKGMGIDEVVVKDYMPFRYKKVILDKHFDEEEAYQYQTRLTTKNLATYFRIVSNIKGIEIKDYPDVGNELVLKITDEIEPKNKFLEDLFDLGISIGNKTNKVRVNKI